MAETLGTLAREKGTTVAGLATAWVLSRGEDIVPLVGARGRDQLAESLHALEVRLTTDDLGRIENAVPRGAAAGDRYPTPLMAHLDSERRSG
jgi:aryl-alcohol dehydrogenase-like predicted oxidoreductase